MKDFLGNLFVLVQGDSAYTDRFLPLSTMILRVLITFFIMRWLTQLEQALEVLPFYDALSTIGTYFNKHVTSGNVAAITIRDAIREQQEQHFGYDGSWLHHLKEMSVKGKSHSSTFNRHKVPVFWATGTGASSEIPAPSPAQFVCRLCANSAASQQTSRIRTDQRVYQRQRITNR